MSNHTCANVPYLTQWLGLWAMTDGAFRALHAGVLRLDLAAHLKHQAELRQDAAAQPRADTTTQPAAAVDQREIAILRLDGTLMKHASSFGDATSTVLARRQLRELGANAQIAAILMVIDSPGGTVAGTEELADEVAAVAALKPLHVYIEDCGCSAAYWVASQAAHVGINAGGMCGSIGTYGVVVDESKAYEADGIKVHVVRAGEFKGVGTPGTAIEPQHLAELQQQVDTLNARFLAGVERGRRLSAEQVRTLADGRVFIGAAALAARLVDAVESYDAALQRLQLAVAQSSGGDVMQLNSSPAAGAAQVAVVPVAVAASPAAAAPQPTATPVAQHAAAPVASNGPQAATLAELRAACVGAPADFLLAQLDAQATVSQASAAWMQRLVADRDAALAKAAEAAKATAVAKPGVRPIATAPATPPEPEIEPSPSDGEDDETVAEDAESKPATARFRQLVAARIKQGQTQAVATRAVVAANPQLHREMLAENRVAHPAARRR